MSKKALLLKITFSLAVFLILGNLAFLDWQILKEKQEASEKMSTVFRPTPTPTLIFEKKETTSSAEKSIVKDQGENCPQACLLAIDQAVKATPAPTGVPSASTPSVKISYLPLGPGSTKSQDWADIAGLNTYIDPANYGKVKSIIFEASLRIPTANGRVYARLYNKNDGRPVWFSEISSEGATSTLIQSVPITFEVGNKLYQVQAKTTMGFESFIDFARIKFITE